jgi:diadenosine tetraphosphate (Ap4A) HIT family hydrolase
METDCIVCKQNSGEINLAELVIWENHSWLIRHHPDPYPVVGWLVLQPKRHVQGVAYFNSREAQEYGPITQAIALALQNTLNVTKVYMIAFGESVPHMHQHFVPRNKEMPDEFLAFGISDLFRGVLNRTIESKDANDVRKLIESLRELFKDNPPIS